jgi:hypothetical protein
MTEDLTGRKFERVLTNVLPYRASSARAQAVYDPATSDPFIIGEIVAVRDAPATPYYLAEVIAISATSTTVHYFGCRQRDLARATFRPAWHLPNGNEISLASPTRPEKRNGPHRRTLRQLAYTGVLEFDALRQLLVVARNLEFTTAHKLRKKSQGGLAPTHDELFVFD